MARSPLARLPQEAKIYVIILALIAVPSLVLTWLATRVVTQELKTLGEKTQQIYENAVNEEARRAVNLLSETGRSVASLAARQDFLDAEIDYVVAALDKERRSRPALDLYFVYDEQGVRRVPIGNWSSFFWDQNRFSALPPDATLRQALRHEYEERDYPKAIAAYHAAAESAGSSTTLLVAALNGEARCYLRSGDYETAIERYRALQGQHLLHDSSGVPAEVIGRYQVGYCLRLQNRTGAFVNQRLQFLRWLFSRDTVLMLDPLQHAFYERVVREEIEQALGGEPEALAREREEYQLVEREGRDLMARQASERQLVQWLTVQVQPKVLFDMAAGPFGPRGAVFMESATAPGEPALVCYGLCRRPEDGTVKWAFGYILSSEALRNELDPAKVPELRFLEPSNLRAQILDSASNALVGQRDEPFTVVVERRLGAPYPPWQIRMIAIGPVPVPAIVKARTALLVGLMIISATALGLGIFVTIRISAREIRTARMRSDFVSAVSHELKTPLTSISMFAEMLLAGRYRSEEERQGYVQAIAEECERLSRLIGRVLDFARIERGARVYHFEPLHPAELVQDALDTLQAQFEREGAQVQTEIAPDLPTVQGDLDALSEVLLNLLGNALKYSPSDKRLLVRAWHDGGSVRISVTDHGIGISPRDQKRIFDKFYRADDPYVQETDGTGLGLTVSRSIVRAHQGDIEVHSEPGQGSTFTVILPACPTHGGRPG